MVLSERLERLRGYANDLSLRELSKLAGLYETHAALIERGRGASSATAVKLAHVFGVSLDWLLTGAGPEPKPAAVCAAVERARATQHAKAVA